MSWVALVRARANPWIGLPGCCKCPFCIALALSQLSNPRDTADQVNGSSFTEFYGTMASRIGSALNSATSQQQVQQASVAQAQNLRKQSSGVDLDEEAMLVVEFERAYQANARLITVLNQLTQDTINMLGG